jgi:energy-coupling factor transporter ATP-binding protein EcfA2
MTEAIIAASSAFRTYHLETLGWKAFQDLCSMVMSEVLGQTFETFAPGNDGGRDGAFRGTWSQSSNEALTGSFTAQCKFTSKTDATLTLSVVGEELEKARQLAQEGLADNYILMTNLSVTAQSAAAISKALTECGVQNTLIIGRERLTMYINEEPRLRRLVPRVYGLGDLTQIIDERAYAQAEQLLTTLRDDLAKFVPTKAYRRAAKALGSHGFVLLLGEPACGKSTIAQTLALAALDEWKLHPVKIDSPEDFKEHWNPHEPHQFFWIDDMFGATQYQSDLGDRWNQVLLRLNAAVKAGIKVVATSRDYIYRRAQTELKISAFPLLSNSQVIIDIQELTADEKADILYTHLRRGDQGRAFRRAVKPHLDQVVKSSHFRPEIARRLGTPIFTKNLEISLISVLRFFAEPEGFLVDVINGLGADEQSTLAILFMHGGSVQSPVELSETDRSSVERLGGSASGVIRAFGALRDSLLKLVNQGNGPWWTFRHPTIGDAFGTLTAQNSELLDIYLRGTPTDKLLREVTCGVTVPGVKVVVPPSRYGIIADRVNAFREAWTNRRMAYHFLAERGSSDFLQEYVRTYPLNWDELVRSDAALSASAEMRLVKRLNDLQLLPSEQRLRLMKAVIANAVDIPSADFLEVKWLREIFTPKELGSMVIGVKRSLLPSLDQIVADWTDNYDEGDDPEAYFEDLKSALTALDAAFRDPDATRDIKLALAEIDDRIEELTENMPPEPDDDRDDWDERSNVPSDRSVFDDVDE